MSNHVEIEKENMSYHVEEEKIHREKGNENMPNIEFDLEVMDKLFHNENWTKQPNKWSSWADCVKENLSALETKELKKQ